MGLKKQDNARQTLLTIWIVCFFTIIFISRCPLVTVSNSAIIYANSNAVDITNATTTLQQNIIPKIVWQTWKDKEVLSLKNMQRMRQNNPNWTFNLMTDADIIEWFENTTNDEIVQIAYKSYKLINPEIGAARADIWRYAIIWHYGGIYLDVDSEILDFDALYNLANDGKYGVVLSHETYGYPKREFKRKRVIQWCFMARPRHNLFANTIKLIYHTLIWDQPKSGISWDKKMKESGMYDVVKFHTGSVIFGRALDLTVMKDGDDDIRFYGVDFEDLVTFKVAEYIKYKNSTFRNYKALFRLALQ